MRIVGRSGRIPPSLFVLLVLLLTACSGTALFDTSARPGRSPAASPPLPRASATPGTLLVSPVPPPPPAPVGLLDGPGVARVGPGGTDLASEPGGRVAGRLRVDIPVPVSSVEKGWAKLLTPCEVTRWAPVGSLTKVTPPRVVLDPGHGGAEPGAVGPSKLAEKTINLTIAIKAAQLLEADGIPAVLTRTGDYRATLPFRVAVAAAAPRPALLVSIHHNAEPDGPMDRPGSETYFQIGSADSRRLAGLMYEEAIRVLSPLQAKWVGDRDAGAKWRPNSSGGDYYGILRRAREAGVTAILAELAFISNPSEEALLQKEETLSLEAEAVARAVTRYLRSKDPGSGFTTPYPREQPAGPGGGRTGCVDPS